MPKRRIQSDVLLLPSRRWLRQFSHAMMVGLCLVLLAMSKTGNPAAVSIRTGILDIVTPVVAFVSAPFDAVGSVVSWLSGVAATHSENIALKNQNIQLLQWQQTAKRLEIENQSLRALMQVVPSKQAAYITTQIVSDFGGPYARSALINGGSAQGVKKDQAVISGSGLIGRVMDVGQSSARVLLLGDINSRIPVVAETSGERAILTGNNDTTPRLAYLPAHSAITVGERIVTSGDGGVFPAGIPVGVVTAVEDGAVTVRPFGDVSRAGLVSVVDYQF